jgi:putative PEP-CTERM system TPR-repeat lipoprotein
MPREALKNEPIAACEPRARACAPGVGRWCLGLALGSLLLLAGCHSFRSPESSVKQGQAAMASADYRGAVIYFKTALEAAPDNIDARLGLAASALALGDLLSAEKELARAEALKAPSGRIEPLKWQIALALGRLAETEKALAEPREGLPEVDRLRYRAEALGRLGRFDEAIAVYRQVLAMPAAPMAATIGLATVLSVAGRPDEALAELAPLIAREPGNTAALVARGEILRRAGRVEEAAAAFADARKHADPHAGLREFAAAATGAAETGFALGRLDEVRSAVADLTARLPNAAMTLFLRARLALIERHPEAALEALGPVLRAQPQNAEALMLAGLAQADLGNLAQAETSLAQAFHQQPGNVAVRRALGRVQLRGQRVDAAIATLTSGGEGGLDAGSLVLLGRALLANGDRDGAVKRLEQAVALEPGNAAVKLELASAQIAAGHSAQALTLLDQLPDAPQGQYRQEMLRIFALEPAKRADEVRGFIAKHPTDAGAHNLGGLYFLSQGQLSEGRTEFEEALKVSPEDPASLANLARLEVQAERLDAAAAALERLLKARPQATQARVALAEVAAKRGDAAEAKRWLEEARAKDPRAIEPRLMLARAAVSDGRFDAARSAAQEALALDPRRLDVLTTAAYVEERAGDAAKALAFAAHAAEATPEAPEPWFVKARYQAAVGDLKGARASLEKCLALRPDWPIATGELALIAARSGDFREAQKLAATLTAKPATQYDGLVLEGDVEAAQGNNAAAVDRYTRALQLRPVSIVVLRRFQAQSRGHLAGAVEGLKDWLRQHPDDGAVRFNYAEALQAKGDRPGAIAEYERILTAAPNSAPTLNNLAWLYVEAHDQRAIETARKAYAVSPKTPAIADTLGWALVEQGQIAEGLGFLRNVAGGGADPNIRFHFAAALAKAGDKAESKQVLDSILAGADRFDSRAAADKLRKELE